MTKKILMPALLGATVFWTTSALAEEGTLSRWTSKLTQDLSTWALNSNENLRQVEQAIHEKHHIRPRCDRGYFGLYGALSVDHCAIGLTRLGAALDNVKPVIEGKHLKDVRIELGRPGHWQGLTFQDRQMVMPYNATPELMSQFISSEMKLLYATSLKDLMYMNDGMADRMQKKYFVKVEQAPGLSIYQWHDGLKKAEVAMMMIYGNAAPSQDQFRKLGIDTLVIDQSSSKAYEDKGVIAVNLDTNSHPGEMFYTILHAVEPPRQNWNPVSTTWNWGEVTRFRENRARSQSLSESLQNATAVPQVRCQLDSSKSGYINIQNCRQALEAFQREVAASEHMRGFRNPRGARAVVIKDMAMLRSYDFDDNHRVLTVDYKASPTKFIEGLGGMTP